MRKLRLAAGFLLLLAGLVSTLPASAFDEDSPTTAPPLRARLFTEPASLILLGTAGLSVAAAIQRRRKAPRKS